MAVKTALEELYEFNGSGRYPVSVLWNFERGRKATVKEGIIAHMKNLKRKRTWSKLVASGILSFFLRKKHT